MNLLGYQCQACGHRNPRDAKFCRVCGAVTKRPERRLDDPGFDWRWMLGGTVIITLTALGFLYGINEALGSEVLAWSLSRRFFLLITIVSFSFFVGGILVGRMSAGVTLKEPAAAGAVACLIVFFVAKNFVWAGTQGYRVFDVQVGYLVLMLPLCVGLAYVGGWVGEKWQGTI
ncbi:MAG: zinc ribbon domain-containing protein [Polyangia bacterium]|jgi:ribosomal protein L40E|nr:zinc ribbon domain-containing protein [Polyangia bacterium]